MFARYHEFIRKSSCCLSCFKMRTIVFNASHQTLIANQCVKHRFSYHLASDSLIRDSLSLCSCLEWGLYRRGRHNVVQRSHRHASSGRSSVARDVSCSPVPCRVVYRSHENPCRLRQRLLEVAERPWPRSVASAAC